MKPGETLEAGYRKTRFLAQQANLNAVEMHSLGTHYDRLFNGENDELLLMSVEQIYEKYAGFSREEL